MTKESIWEKIVRFSPAAIAMSACLAVMSSVGLSRPADNDIAPLSASLLAKGDAAYKVGSADEATGFYETALAVDPRNRQAYISLARLVESQGLSGKSIRFYDEALQLDPNDMVALKEQARVMVGKRAFSAARKNASRLRVVCRTDCAFIGELESFIEAEANKKPVIKPDAVENKPVASSDADSKDADKTADDAKAENNEK